MTNWGSYEPVKELAQSGLGFLWSARPANAVVQGETYIIKTTEGLAILGDPERLARESALFLEAARAQAKLVEAGAKHWAKLHEFGSTDAGAFYVSDMYARSVQKVVARGIRLDARSLSLVVHAVVDGLIELRDHQQRPHGNLKGSNVLIGGPDGPAVNDDPVVLTDLKPGSAVTKQDSAGDLAALGRLIYEMVLLRPARDQIGLNVSMSDDWSRLGSAAPAWVDLCNLLMGGVPGRPMPDLEEVRGMIPTAKARSAARRWPLAAAAVVLAAGAVGGYIAFGPKPVDPVKEAPLPPLGIEEMDKGWSAFVYDWRAWFQPNTRALLAEELRKLDGVEPGALDPLLAALAPKTGLKSPSEAINKGAVDLRDLVERNAPRQLSVEKPEEWKKVEGSVSTSMRAVGAARDAILAVLNKAPLDATGRAWRDRGWTSASRSLESAAGVATVLASETSTDRPEPMAIAEAVAAALKVQGVETKFKAVETLAAELAKSEAALGAVADVAAAEASAALGRAKPGGEFEALTEAITRVESVARDLRAKLDPAVVDLASVRRTPEYAKLTARDAKLDLAGMQAFRAELSKEDVKPLKGDAEVRVLTQTAEGLAARLAKTRTSLEKAKAKGRVEAPRAAELEKQLSELGDALKAVGLDDAGKALVVSGRSRAVFLAEYAKLDSSLKVFEDKKVIPRSEVEDEAGLRRTAGALKFDAAPELNALWTKLVDAMAAGGPGLDFGDKNDLLVEEWKPVLDRLGAVETMAKPAASGFDEGKLAGAWSRKRSEALRAIAAAAVDATTLTKPSSFAESAPVKAAQAAYEAWRSGAEKALADAAKAGELLTAAYLPGDASGGGDPAVLVRAAQADSDLSPVVEPITVRLRGLEAIRNETAPGALLDRLGALTPAQAAERLAAWEKLGTAAWSAADVTGGAPAKAAAVAAAHKAALEGSGLSDERRGAVGRVMSASSRAVWSGLAAASLRLPDEAARAAAFASARGSAAAFGAGQPEADKLGVRAGYDWRVLDAREAIGRIDAGASAEAQGSEVARALKAVEDFATAGSLAGEKDVAELLKALRRAADPNGKGFSVSEVGPASSRSPVKAKMGWDEGKENDNGTVVFASGRHTLAFVTVMVGGQEVLVSTREVTAGLVAEVLKESTPGGDTPWGGDPAGTTTLLQMPSGRDEPRTGPRVWTSENGKDLIAIRVEASRAKATWYGWFPWNTTMGGGAASIAWLPDGVRVGPPTLDHPMQQVTPEAAVLVARRLGCRLPTVEEWRAARQAAPQGEAPNLRDASWRAVRDPYVAAIDAWNRNSANTAKQITAQLPSGGVYLPKALAPTFEAAKDDAVTAQNDGEPLFRSARGQASDAAVYDLVGNVAEFVLADAAAKERVEGLGMDCKADEAFGLFASGKEFSYGLVRVIGGSAIAPPPPEGYAPDAPQEVWKTSPEGYSDVGFRLAISKGDGTTGKTPKERAMSALERKAKILGLN